MVVEREPPEVRQLHPLHRVTGLLVAASLLAPTVKDIYDSAGEGPYLALPEPAAVCYPAVEVVHPPE